MLRFFFKKNFYDGWDNVLYFFVPNLIFDAVLLVFGTAAFFVTRMPDSLAAVGIVVWALCALVVVLSGSIISLAWAETASEIVDYGVIEFKDFFRKIKACVKDGVIYGLVLYFVAIVAVVGTTYYLKPQFSFRAAARLEKSAENIGAESYAEAPVLAEGDLDAEPEVGRDVQGSFVGLLAGFVFLWVSISVFMALFWYPALRSLMHNPFGKSVKKCFVILFDNPGKCIVFGLYNIFLLFVSVVMLGLAPGIAGIGLSRENALYLLLKKYDYLSELDEKNEPLSSPKRRRIPWREILSDDIEATGTRTFKGFFMPWKELEEQGAKDVKRQKLEEVDERWKE